MIKGAGSYPRPLVSFYLLVAAIDRVADGDGVAVDKEVSRANSVFQCRVSGVIQLIISFFFFNDTII